MRYILLLLLTLSCSLFSGCTGTPSSHLTQIDPDDESGLGGTGIIANDSGIGGTGRMANGSGLGGTGIIGEVTGFGSIFVNGIEVEIDSHSRLIHNDQVVKQYDFARGDVVEIIAYNRQSKIFASEIHIRNLVIGPVESVNKQNRSIRVLGQTVVLPEQTNLPQNAQFVQVSGFRDTNDQIHASRIMPVAERSWVWLSGRATKVDRQTLRIGQQLINVKQSADINLSRPLNIRGTVLHGRILVNSIKPQVSIVQNNSLDHLYLQGYLGALGTIPDIGELPLKIEHSQLDSITNINKPVRIEMHRNRHGQWQFKRMIPPGSMPVGQPQARTSSRANIPGQLPKRPPVNIPRMPRNQPGRFKMGR